MDLLRESKDFPYGAVQLLGATSHGAMCELNSNVRGFQTTRFGTYRLQVVIAKSTSAIFDFFLHLRDLAPQTPSQIDDF